MSKKYYTLLSRVPGELWAIEFGDYSRPVVAQEERDIRDSAREATRYLIVATGDAQSDINAKVEELNDDLRRKRPSVFEESKHGEA